MLKKSLIVLLWSVSLCSMEPKKPIIRYNTTTFLAANNATSNQGPSWHTLWSVDTQCQNFSIEEQLEKGARALVLPIGQVKNDEVYVFNGPGQADLDFILPQKVNELLPFVKIHIADAHGSYFDPGITTLKQVLGVVKTFMDKNPKSGPLTLFLQDQTKKHGEIKEAFNSVQEYLYTKKLGKKWLSLEKMKKKLVVFVNNKKGISDSPEWFHDLHEFFSVIEPKFTEEGIAEPQDLTESIQDKMLFLKLCKQPANNGRSPWNPYCIGGKKEDAQKINGLIQKYKNLYNPNFIAINFMTGNELAVSNKNNNNE